MCELNKLRVEWIAQVAEKKPKKQKVKFIQIYTIFWNAQLSDYPYQVSRKYWLS